MLVRAQGSRLLLLVLCGALGSACECGMTHEMWPRAASPKRATERLSRLEDSRLLYRLKHRWRDGTTHVVFTPRE